MQISINASAAACAPGRIWVDYTATQEPYSPLRSFLQVPEASNRQEQETAIRAHIQQRGGIMAFPDLYDMSQNIMHLMEEVWESPHETGRADLNEQTLGLDTLENIDSDICTYHLTPHIMRVGETLYADGFSHSLFNWASVYTDDEPAIQSLKACAVLARVQINLDRTLLCHLGLTAENIAESLTAEKDTILGGIRIRSTHKALAEDDDPILDARLTKRDINHESFEEKEQP